MRTYDLSKFPGYLESLYIKLIEKSKICKFHGQLVNETHLEFIWWGINLSNSTILIDSSLIASGTSLKLVITLVGSSGVLKLQEIQKVKS